MIVRICICAIICAFGLNANSQSFWEEKSSSKLSQKDKTWPEGVAVFELRFVDIKNHLQKAPQEFTQEEKLILELPVPDQGMKKFEVWKSSVMQPGLQAKYPNIQSYKAKEVNGLLAGRFDISINGFYGFFKNYENGFYLEPNPDNKKEVLVYSKKVSKSSDVEQTCGFDDLESSIEETANSAKKEVEKKGGEPAFLRVYRLALATSGEWYVRFGEGSIEGALAKLNTSVNRVNEIYERDVAIRFLLIDRNDELIFTDPDTDPYEAQTSGRETVGSHSGILNGLIGASSYDIGEVYMRCTDVGGVASGRVCLASKGNSVTCWFNDDVIGVSEGTVSHEIAHMFSGGHTWSNCDNPDQRSSDSAYEPGSGNSILSYSGSCGDNNTSGSRGTFFHIHSCIELMEWSRETTDCAEIIATGNTNPIAKHNYPNNFFVPISTPFVLDGIATDNENDNLSYKWEQYNLGPRSSLGEPIGNAPCFKSYGIKDHTDRTFPIISSVISGRDNKSEVLVDYERDFKFRFIVRDNNIEAGGLDWTDVNFRTTTSAGPFKMEFPNERETLVISDPVSIQWDVANTDNSTVNCQKVDIYFSINNGNTYSKLLIGTPNDGEETITVPNVLSNFVRFKVQANDNIFFDISDTPSKIVEPQVPTYLMAVRNNDEAVCLPAQLSIPITTTSYQGYAETVNFEIVEGLPEDATVSFTKNDIISGDSTVLVIDFLNRNNSLSTNVKLRSTSATGIVIEKIIPLTIVGNDFSELAMMSPANGESQVSVFPKFEWTASQAADIYNLEVATSPAFGSSVVSSVFGVNDSNTNLSDVLEKNTLYFWRVWGENGCGEQEINTVHAFHTASLFCSDYESTDLPTNISLFGTPTVESEIDVNDTGLVQDVNVKRVAGLHQNVGDLKLTLTSPSGNSAVLIDRECDGFTDFDMNFDDESPLSPDCPISVGQSYMPVESMTVFQNEDRQGTWTLVLEDLASGGEGTFTNFSLEICAGVQVIFPILQSNSLLVLDNDERKNISQSLLETTDEDNSADEVNYIVVSTPNEGLLYMNDNILSIGDQFAQQDINDGLIAYQHTGEDLVNDDFEFVVTDGNGGWNPTNTFNIQIDFPSSIDDTEFELGLQVFPNPTSDILFINFDQPMDQVNIKLFDTSGKVVYSHSTEQLNKLNVSTSDLPKGMYFLNIQTLEGEVTKKIFVTE